MTRRGEPLRGVASHQHVAGLEQRALALQDERMNFELGPQMETGCHGN
jgi:hypothetical protein